MSSQYASVSPKPEWPEAEQAPGPAVLCWCCDQPVDAGGSDLRRCDRCDVQWRESSPFQERVSRELQAARDKTLSGLSARYNVYEYVDHAAVNSASPA